MNTERGGILSSYFKYISILQGYLSQVKSELQVTTFWMLLVTSCYFGLIRNIFSTISAQSDQVKVPSLTNNSAVSGYKSPRKRKREKAEAESNKNKKCSASYARFSSDKQRDESVVDQQRKCHEAAAKNNDTISPDLEFADYAVSGTKRNRQGLNEMLEAASAGEFDTLYIFSLSRLARESIITMPVLKKLVYKFKIRVIFVSDNIDTARPDWETLATIYSQQAERYIKELSSNVFRGQEGNIFRGLSVGDYCFGYTSMELENEGSIHNSRSRYHKPKKVYKICETQADYVQMIFRWFVKEQRSLRWITKELNRLKVPKDHRSSQPEWYHDNVITILTQEKYIGNWRWGESKTVRDPETGDVKQEYRDEEDCKKWIRHIPDLQLIDNDIFVLAQEKLKKNYENWESHRKENGQFTGSASNPRGRTSKKLLSGILRCTHCGNFLLYSGKRMKCRGNIRLTCSNQTSVLSSLAESKILQAIQKHLNSNEEWMKLIYQRCLADIKEFREHVPGTIEAKKQELSDLGKRIEKLLDACEGGHKDPDLYERLTQRRDQKEKLAKEIEQLEFKAKQFAYEPDEKWIREKLKEIGSTISEYTPAANSALKSLIKGPIEIYESKDDRSKRKFLKAKWKMSLFKVNSISQSLDQIEDIADDETYFIYSEVDLVDRTATEEQQQRVMELYHQGLKNKDIGKRMGLSRARITFIIKQVFATEGKEMPDGRARRHTLSEEHLVSSLYKEISDKVKELYDQGVLLGDIARQLNVDRNTITKSVNYWYEKRGLKAPDGRTRRKSLPHQDDKCDS